MLVEVPEATLEVDAAVVLDDMAVVEGARELDAAREDVTLEVGPVY